MTEKPCIGDEAVLAVVSRIMMDKRATEVMRENERLKKRLDLIDNVLKEKCGAAWDLVWYARVASDDVEAREGRERVERLYPAEVKKLQFENDACDWQHGWNSALLALSNLIGRLIHAEDDAKQLQSDGSEQSKDGQPLLTAADLIGQALAEYPTYDT